MAANGLWRQRKRRAAIFRAADAGAWPYPTTCPNLAQSGCLLGKKAVDRLLSHGRQTLLWCQISELMPGDPRSSSGFGDTGVLSEDSVMFHAFLPFIRPPLPLAEFE
jgi:hypothetical protein